MWYKNLSRLTVSFYGVTFKPGEVKQVPKAINHTKFIQVAAPVEVKPAPKPVESIKKPAKVAEPKRKPETKSEPKPKVEVKPKTDIQVEVQPELKDFDSSNK